MSTEKYKDVNYTPAVQAEPPSYPAQQPAATYDYQGQPPPQGYAPPPQGYAPPPQGYAGPPPAGYGPPPQGYAAPPQGYAAPPQGYPQKGYPPPQGQPYVTTTQPLQQVTFVTTTQQRPNNWMIPSILACFFCFWPIGIAAIACAYMSSTAADRGDMDESQRKASLARTLTIVSVVVGAICIGIIVVLRVVALTSYR